MLLLYLDGDIDLPQGSVKTHSPLPPESLQSSFSPRAVFCIFPTQRLVVTEPWLHLRVSEVTEAGGIVTVCPPVCSRESEQLRGSAGRRPCQAFPWARARDLCLGAAPTGLDVAPWDLDGWCQTCGLGFWWFYVCACFDVEI